MRDRVADGDPGLAQHLADELAAQTWRMRHQFEPEPMISITEFTKAIIPVCLFGLPVDFDPIMALAKKHDLVVITAMFIWRISV